MKCLLLTSLIILKRKSLQHNDAANCLVFLKADTNLQKALLRNAPEEINRET